MVALYERIEAAFGGLFARYGRFLATYPWTIVIISAMFSSMMGLGILQMKSESDVEVLYTPRNSQASKDRTTLKSLFPSATTDEFISYQLTTLGNFGEVIISASDGGNVITEDIITELFELDSYIRKNISITYGRETYYYDDLCAMYNSECATTSLLNIIDEDDIAFFIASPLTWPVAVGSDGDKNNTIELEYLLGGANLTSTTVNVSAEESGVVNSAEVMRFRWHLREDTKADRDLAEKWEDAFVEAIPKFATNHTTLVYSSSNTLNTELDGGTSGDVFLFSITFTIMCTYASIASSGGNWVSSRGLLANCGVIAAALSVCCSFGFNSLIGVPMVDIVGVTPFLILGIGVDDMFILMSGFKSTDPHDPIEKRMAETMRTSAVSITITSFTDLLAFGIGATSVFPSVTNFCIYTGVAVIVCYVNQITFFAGCLVIHARRVAKSLHSCTCHPVKSKEVMIEEKENLCKIIWCNGEAPQKYGDDDSLCEMGPRKFFPMLVLNIPAKIIILIAFGVYLGFAIYGATNLEEGLEMNFLAADDSYFQDTIHITDEYFSDKGPVINVVFKDSLEYWDSHVQTQIAHLLDALKSNSLLESEFEISWLSSFISYCDSYNINVTASDNFIQNLIAFIDVTEVFTNDIKFSDDGSEIVASRVYVQSRGLGSTTMDGIMMTEVREELSKSDFDVFAFTAAFIFFEQYVAVLPSTLQTVGIAVAAMFVVSCIFIPHPLIVIYIVLTMIMILIGMFGYMHLWGLSLNAITMIQIILSIGFCIDFCAHICHEFMVTKGESRDERMRAALHHMGVPVFNAGLSSLLGIFMLTTANSYIFISFFKTMFLVIVFGIGHALLFLPVVLSLIGPKGAKEILETPVLEVAVDGEAQGTVEPEPGSNNSGYTSYENSGIYENVGLRKIHIKEANSE